MHQHLRIGATVVKLLSMKRAATISGVLFLAIACSSSTPQLNVNSPTAHAVYEIKPQFLAQELQSASNETPAVCPADMVEINGDFCPEIVENCINLDKSVHNANGYVRCLEFAPTKCISPDNKKIHMHFCMDTYEWPNKKDVKPIVMVTWYDMKKSCEDQDKRLCVDNEWSLACEGPEILPYPYGLKRDAMACNIDHPQRPWFDASKSPMTPDIVARLDQSVPAGSMPACVSPYGVHDMTGNADEWVVNSNGHSANHYPYFSGLKGGHWVIGARNRCRPETDAHGPTTVFYEIGGRCCKDIP